MSTPTPDEQDIESTLGHLSKAELLSLIKRMVQLYPDLAGLIETVQQATPSQKHRNSSADYSISEAAAHSI